MQKGSSKMTRTISLLLNMMIVGSVVESTLADFETRTVGRQKIKVRDVLRQGSWSELDENQDNSFNSDGRFRQMPNVGYDQFNFYNYRPLPPRPYDGAEDYRRPYYPPYPYPYQYQQPYWPAPAPTTTTTTTTTPVPQTTPRSPTNPIGYMLIDTYNSPRGSYSRPVAFISTQK